MGNISQNHEIAQNFTAHSIMTLDLWQIIHCLENYLNTKVNWPSLGSITPTKNMLNKC